jgi:hypothetical protein
MFLKNFPLNNVDWMYVTLDIAIKMIIWTSVIFTSTVNMKWYLTGSNYELLNLNTKKQQQEFT